MNLIKNLKKVSNLQISVSAAILLFSVGFGALLYTHSAIQGYTQLLSSPALSMEETWRYEGALQWWRNTYATAVLPLASIMITVGAISLIGPTAWTKIRQRHVLKTFMTELELASNEKFEIE